MQNKELSLTSQTLAVRTLDAVSLQAVFVELIIQNKKI
jgi:hypothetical protein